MEKPEDDEPILSPWAVTLLVVVILLVVLFAGIAYLKGPYDDADRMRERLNDIPIPDESYRQGWLDCVDYYIWLKTMPTNMTSAG